MKRLIVTLVIALLLTVTAFAQTSGTTLDNVNLRTSAGFGNNILTQVPINSTVAINGRNGDGSWLQINYNGVNGWVSSRYVRWDGVELMDLQPVGGEFSAPAPLPPTNASNFSVTTTTRLNIRTEPRIFADIITTLPAGQNAVATGRSRDGAWVSINTGSIQGWVSGAYLASTVDLMGLPVTSDFFNAPVEVLPEEDPVADIIISDDGQYTFTGPAVGNTTSYDVEITLHWNSTANLDLRVIGPDGYEIAAGRTQSPTGGYFQQPVGANEHCPSAGRAPIEVITWRLGTAPSGVYRIIAEHVNSCNAAAEDKTLFWVRVNNDGPEAAFWVDYINPDDVFEFTFVRP